MSTRQLVLILAGLLLALAVGAMIVAALNALALL